MDTAISSRTGSDFPLPAADLESLGFDEFAEENNLTSEVSQAVTSSLIHSVALPPMLKYCVVSCCPGAGPT